MEIKMFRSAFLLLACSMCMTIVRCEIIFYVEHVPPAVNRLDVQCRLAGHLGSCNRLMFETGQLDCSHVECAARRNPIGGLHRVVDIGSAANGTHCGTNRVCLHGSCIELPPNTLMPREIGGNLRGDYECLRLPPGRPNYPRNRMQ